MTTGQQGTFLCFATCTPSCDFSWRFRNHTYIGDEVLLPILQQGDKPQYARKLVMTVDDYSNTYPLVCQVRNDASQAVISATKELTLIGECVLLPSDFQHRFCRILRYVFLLDIEDLGLLNKRTKRRREVQATNITN